MTQVEDPEHSQEAYDLDPIEIRVLGVLIEKASVTPDAYPLSVNAIVSGCNQLTGRDPVMALSETQVQEAIDRLLARRLISKRDQANARVARYEHLVRLRYSIPLPEQAVLAILMLRGPQTPGEIRQRAERMHAFADIAAVEVSLEHLADKFPPMVAALPRALGTKETRHAHLMGGLAAIAAYSDQTNAARATRTAPSGRAAELEDEVRRLRQDVDELRREFLRFRAQFE